MLDFNAEMLSFDHLDHDRQNNGSDRTEKAVVLYNAAINDIRSGNDDIAYIKLKKAVSLKQDLFAAWVVIGLYTAKTGNIQEALSIFDEAAENSSEYGEKALRYIRALNAEKTKRGAADSKEKEKRKLNIDRSIVFLIVGILAGVIMSLPFMLKKGGGTAAENEKDIVISSLEAELEQRDQMLEGLESDMGSLEKAISELEKEIERLEGEDRIETIIIDLTEEEAEKIANDSKELVKEDFREYLFIIELYYDNKILEAADRIKIFKNSSKVFTDELETELSLFYEKLMDRAARYCEDRGVSLFEQGRYNDSLAMLSRARTYRADYSRMYRVYYYMGMDHLRKGEYEAAKEGFLKTRELAPNRDWEGYADLRLREIEEIQSAAE